MLITTICIFIISFVWFQMGISGHFENRYPVDFSGLSFFVICFGMGTSDHGKYVVFGNIPLTGHNAFFSTLKSHKTLMVTWFLSVLSGLPLAILVIFDSY